ncbi:MAG TPA: diguanylate cyclase [Chloroflexia bacterium]|nr:diguanylate cyclase [Chloroflexia bacterium]
MTMLTPCPKGTVLVVDDNITNLKVASEHLRAEGFEVLISRDGLSCIDRARLAHPDLILLDVQMAGIDGFETCRRLKADSQVKDIPVIFMTVLTNMEDKLKGFAAGAVDYVPKPFQIEELLARVNAHLTLYKLQRELQAEIRERQLAETALRKANQELQRLAVLDELTRLANRRRFDQYLQAQWEHTHPLPVSLILCDIDYFKRYNDGYGHQAGDQCLYQVAQGISRVVGREKDLVARYGGEEFGVILPETGIAGAVEVARSILAEIHKLKLPHAYSEVSKHITLSIGVSSLVPSASATPGDLIEAADRLLYQAKHDGRNRVVSPQISLNPLSF